MTTKTTSRSGDPDRALCRAQTSSRAPSPGRGTAASTHCRVESDDDAKATASKCVAASAYPTSFRRIFQPSDVLAKLREIHGSDFLSELDLGEGVPLQISQSAEDGERQLLTTRSDCKPISHAAPAPRPTIQQQLINLAVQRTEWDSDARARHEQAFANLSTEEHLRSRRLHELLSDTQEGWRAPLMATPSTADAIADLHRIAPQFSKVISVVANAAAMSRLTGLPLQLPPLLLLGQPGLGKSFFAGRLAEALGTTLVSLQMNLSPAFGLIAGLAPAWRGAAPGRIATTLLSARNTSPVVVIDELDKVIIASAHDRPLDAFHSLWEPENSRCFKDEYFDLPFDASGIISIATANAITGISPSLIDRLLVVQISPLTADQKREIAQQIYSKAIGALANRIEPELRPDLLDRLGQETPRRMSRLVALALPIAFAAGRDAIHPDDLAIAQALLDSAKGPAQPTEARKHFGFIPPSEEL